MPRKKRRTKKPLRNVMFDIYRELYLNSEPSADFDYLVESAEVMEDGRKKIPYEDYEIDKDAMENIIHKHIYNNGLSENEQKSIRVAIYLGYSPMTKRSD